MAKKTREKNSLDAEPKVCNNTSVSDESHVSENDLDVNKESQNSAGVSEGFAELMTEAQKSEDLLIHNPT